MQYRNAGTYHILQGWLAETCPESESSIQYMPAFCMQNCIPIKGYLSCYPKIVPAIPE